MASSTVPLAFPPLRLPSLQSFNLVPSLRSLVFALLVLVVVAFTRFLFSPRRPLSLVERNTRLNRRENGGTGVFSRKLRRLVFPAIRYGDEAELAEGGIDDTADELLAAWRIISRPVPSGLKGCLRKVEQFEEAIRVAVMSGGEAQAAEEKEDHPSPLPPPAPAPAPTPARKPSKQVRVVEPNLSEIEALRVLWSSPEMQGEYGAGGIGGYRRTRDFYSRSQGGKALIKRPGAAAPAPPVVEAKGKKEDKAAPAGKLVPATSGDNDEDLLTTDEESPPAASRPTRRRQPTPPVLVRASSHSPSPLSRRTHTRTLSPSPLAVGAAAAKVSPSRRRALSPGTAPASRSSSAPPSADRLAAGGGAVPRWVKTKGGRMASPAPSRLAVSAGAGASDDEADEEEEVEDFADEENSDEQGGSPRRRLSESLSAVITATRTIPRLVDPLAPPSPISPVWSAMSGAESEQESPTPSVLLSSAPAASAAPSHAALPKLAISPATPPLAMGGFSLPSSVSPTSSSSPTQSSTPSVSPVSSTSPTSLPSPSPTSSISTSTSSASTARSSSRSPSPSPCVQKERRLSLRVQQTVERKERQAAKSGRAAA
ncbi:hypothetical protein JCM10207_004553 [Rhodosporidiobolus poonsookiae]